MSCCHLAAVGKAKYRGNQRVINEKRLAELETEIDQMVSINLCVSPS